MLNISGATAAVKAAVRTAARGADDGARAAAAAPTPPPAAATAVTTPAPAVAATAATTPAPPGSGGMSGASWIGLSAGAAGMALTAINTWRDVGSTQRSITSSTALGPSTWAIGAGAGAMLIADRATAPALRAGLRGGGAVLVLGGLAGAIGGAVQRFLTPATPTQYESNQLQAPKRFATDLPAVAADLAGIELASGDVVAKDRSMRHVSIYAEPVGARVLEAGESLANAIGQARSMSQSDAQNRSHAVVQTREGAYVIMRMSGDLDQVDGRNYATGNDFDARFIPQIAKRQPALQAIAGVESRYVFPTGTGATEPVPDTGEIPWITPQVSATTPNAPGATPTPAPATNGGS